MLSSTALLFLIEILFLFYNNILIMTKILHIKTFTIIFLFLTTNFIGSIWAIDFLPSKIGSINGKIITKEDLAPYLKNKLPNFSQEPDEKTLKEIISFAIQAKIVDEQIKLLLTNNNIQVNQDIANQYVLHCSQRYSNNTKNKFLTAAQNFVVRKDFQLSSALFFLMKKIAPQKLIVSQDEILDYYYKNRKNFALPDKVYLGVIKISGQDANSLTLAKKTLSRLMQGENFNKVAKEINPQGSQLNTNSIEYQNFEADIKELKVNDISKILKGKYDYFIVKLKARQQNVYSHVDDVTPEITTILESQKVSIALTEHLKKIISLMDVKINQLNVKK